MMCMPRSNHRSYIGFYWSRVFNLCTKWILEVSRPGKGYKDKGEPISTTPDRRAGTALDCVGSRNLFFLTFLSTLNILVWCCHFLLIRLAPDISESWQPFLLTALKPETWRTLLSWLFWCHRCLLKPTSFQPLSIDVSFSCHPYLLASLFLETSSLDTLFSSHPILLTRFLYYFVLQILHKVLPSTTSYYKACIKVLPSTTSYYKSCAKYFPVLLRTTKLLQSILPSTTSYYKACTKYFPVLLRTTRLAQSTSQYYFMLQSLHKVLPSTTSYCKACTNSASQDDFVLQSLRKILPRTTLYYKACTRYFPVLLRTTLGNTPSYYTACTEYFTILLRTTKLAQSTSPFYFVLQSLHKVFPRTTSFCKACTNYFPVLLRTTKLAQNTSQFYFIL